MSKNYEPLTLDEACNTLAEAVKENNLSAYIIAEVVNRSKHSTTLQEIRAKLKEDYQIDIHSDGTISKWCNVYGKFCVEFDYEPEFLSKYSIYKLNEIKDVVNTYNVEEWLARTLELTDKELKEELGKGRSETASIVMPRAVYERWQLLRQDVSIDCVGNEDGLSDIQFLEFAMDLFESMTPIQRRNIFAGLQGDVDEQGENIRDVLAEQRQAEDNTAITYG